MSTQPQPAAAPTETRPQAAPLSLLDRIVEEQASVAARYQPVMSTRQAIERREAIKELKNLVLVEGEDYGTIPGTNKPTLLKPGAEKICAFFGYVPSYELMPGTIEDWKGEQFGEPLFYYRVKCTLEKDGHAVGQGTGSCNSWETKYRYRSAQRTCPQCGAAAIIKGKAEYGGGYICFGKKGGCGAKFKDGDKAIEGQETGRIANPDIADVVNTVQKIADKRAYVAATLSATGASQWFTQDMEDVSASGIDTGGHPVNTREAQEHVRDRKLAELQSQDTTQQHDKNGGSSKPADAAVTQQATGSGKTDARQSAGTTSEIPPPSGPGAVPEGIQKLWAEMGTNLKTMLPVLARLKAAIVELTGADVEYYRILAKHGMQHANDVRKAGVRPLRLAAQDMVEYCERCAKSQAPPVEEALPVDDRDDWVPAEIGGDQAAMFDTTKEAAYAHD